MPDRPDAAAKQINDWVDERTGGRIKQLVRPIGPQVVLVLVNATYVKAGWDYFKTVDTRPGTFTLAGGKRVQVPMMHGQIGSDVTQTAAYIALPLMANGLVTVTVVVPKEGQTPESILPLLAHGGLAALDANMHSQPAIVDLALPRLHASFTDSDLGTALQELGISRAFSAQAQFGGITSSPLWISKVVHEATLDLNEQGVEAAAGTAVEMATGALPTKHLIVRVDRPFIVVLSEGESGAPLFMAIVRDPR
jgi:serine protease inhibitor